MNGKRALSGAAAIALLVGSAWLLLYHSCASGGAMASAYRTCTCAGIERVIRDQTEADGPRRTVCLGWVTSRACFQHRDGPRIDCATMP